MVIKFDDESGTEPLSEDEATERLAELVDDIEWREEIITESAAIELDGPSELADTLPPIDQFPIVVAGTGLGVLLAYGLRAVLEAIGFGLQSGPVELRARTVGEGGNLGFTQAARIEYAMAGGLINTEEFLVGGNPLDIDTDGDGQFDDTERLWLDQGGLPLYIKDAFVAYRHSNAFMVRLGMIKTPLGMDFTVPGWNLDIVQRGGLEKALVLERNMGFTFSGRLIGQGSLGDKPMKTNGLEMGAERQGYGFGYDLFVGNPAGRSVSVVWDRGVLGDALAYAGRLHFDYGKPLHVELAYGISEKAGGVESSEDYDVLDFGVASELLESKLELKFEYITGNNVRGEKDRKQTTAVLTAGYTFIPSLQFVVKTYQSGQAGEGA